MRSHRINRTPRAPARAEPLERRVLFDVVEWVGGAAGNWNEPTNWSGGAVPTATDDVRISGTATVQPVVTHNGGDHAARSLSVNNAALTIVGGSLSIASDSTFGAASRLSFGAGVLIIEASARLAGGATMSWSGGTLDGAGTLVIDAGCVLDLHEADQKIISATVRNDGTANWDGGSLTFNAATFINNGTFNASPGTVLYHNSSSWFENAGSFNQSAAGNVCVQGMRFRNTGTIEAGVNLQLVAFSSFYMEGGSVKGDVAVGDFGWFFWHNGEMIAPGTTNVYDHAWTYISGEGEKVLSRTLNVRGRNLYFDGNLTLHDGTLALDNPSYGFTGSGAIRDGGGTNLVHIKAGGLHADDLTFETPVIVDWLHCPDSDLHLLGGGAQTGTISNSCGELHVGGPGFSFAGSLSGNLYFESGVSNARKAEYVQSLHVLDGAHVTFSDDVEVSAAAIVIGDGSTLNLAGRTDMDMLDIGSGAAVRLTGASSQTLRTQSLVQSSLGMLDVGRGSLILDEGTGSLYRIQNLLRGGYRGGAWDGNGICSRYAATNPGNAVGYALATDLFGTFPATFAGQQIDSSALLVTQTLYGDANLDRTVNLADFEKLAANFSTYNYNWVNGNFNYDTKVNLADFNRLAGQFGKSVASDDDAPVELLSEL